MADSSTSHPRSRSAASVDNEHLLRLPSSTATPETVIATAHHRPTTTVSSSVPSAFEYLNSASTPRKGLSDKDPSTTAGSPSSPRVTRASARQAANQTASTANPDLTNNAPSTGTTAPAPIAAPLAAAPAAPSASSKKRKNAAGSASSPPASLEQPASASARRPKRQKVAQAAEQAVPPLTAPPVARASPAASRKKGKAPANMSSPDPLASASSSRRSSRNKKTVEAGSGMSTKRPASGTSLTSGPQDAASKAGPSRRSKKSRKPQSHKTKDEDVHMRDDDDERDEVERHPAPPPPPPPPAEHSDPPAAPDHDSDDDQDDDQDDDGEEDNIDEHRYDDEDDDDDDPFGGYPGGPGHGIAGTLRALSGMIHGVPSRLRELLAGLKQKDNPDRQLVALTELCQTLLFSNDDNLAGHFASEAFVKELVILMQPNEITGEINPEIMLLACRALANMMEVLPASTSAVVYGGAVPVLCQKLLEIEFIDLAEQALDTLKLISVEYPSSIVREGGLSACLSYLDFFATSTQRVAVTTAANCCRNIPADSIDTVRDVMPILLNVLGSSDQRVVEQAALCVSRIVESFKYQPSKLEELVSVDLLKAVLRLLLPGATNLIGPDIHTQFIRVLGYTARASPRLSAELFKLNVVETLYQILTGVSPPSGTEDIAAKLDSVLIMQALIHRPREQVLETLNVICELLPNISKMADGEGNFIEMHTTPAPSTTPSSGRRSGKKSSNEKRIELLEGCKDEVRRFALILFPTLTDAFSSTVNLTVRQKVLTAQLKMLSNLDVGILEETLKAVPFASFLASILSQQDHPSLVMFAIEATGLLMSRLENIYRYQLYREGVIAEITKLASAVSDDEKAPSEPPAPPAPPAQMPPIPILGQGSEDLMQPSDHEDSDKEDEEDEAGHHSSDDEPGNDDDNEDEENDNEDGNDIHRDDESSSEGSTMSIEARPLGTVIPSVKAKIAFDAKKFLEEHESQEQGKAMKSKAVTILDNLTMLANDIKAFYLQRTASSSQQPLEHGVELLEKLAASFDGDVLESVTSAELLGSGVVEVLEQIFSNPNEELATAAQSAFLQVFMGHSVKSKPKTATADSPATPFSIMIHKLQDLLSRSEHFEVLTVHQNAMDGNRSSATSMLAKQIRLRLSADDDSDIPKQYRNIMVSIHAITTFKSLEEYLRPRITLSDRPLGRRVDVLSRAMAAMSAAGLSGFPFGASSAADFAARLGMPPGQLGSAPPPPPPAAASAPNPPKLQAPRKSKSKSKASQQEAPATPEPSSSKAPALRRSGRRNAPTPSAAPPPPPPEADNDLDNALECADEKQMSDDDEDQDMMDMEEAEETLQVLRDFEDSLDDGMDDEDEVDEQPTPDQSAVNLEVAAGGKITARKDDGTRIPTPSQTRSMASAPAPSRPSAQSTLAAALAGSPTPSSSSRTPGSYSAALQARPKDWHIEFSIEGKTIPNDTTIYRAVHRTPQSADEQTRATVWTNTHTIKYKRVPGAAPEGSITFGSSFDGGVEAEEGAIPGSLAKHPTTASILRLLKMLHDLNANIDDVIVENKDTLKLNVEPLSQFVNTKLTAKLNRQLEEPLIVASNCLPSWSEDLARLYPFLFPFETRHLFLQSTSFGYARSMTRWQAAQAQEETRRDRRNDERPFLGRLQRQKVRISRQKILESAIKVMDLYGAAQHILEVEYFEEVGTGLGPTLEFYASVSKEFAKKKLKLWRENDLDDAKSEYVNGPSGLFPRPLSSDYVSTDEGEKILQLFKVLGKFVARSMIDSRIIDINFNPIFFRIGDETAGVRPSLGAVKAVDPVLAKSLKLIKKFALAKKEVEEQTTRSAAQKVEDLQNIIVNNTKLDDLCLDFTLPGSPEIELIPNGSDVALTIENVDLYLEKVIDMTLGSGVRRQVDAFRSGFSDVFPYSALSAFTPDELCVLFGRTDEDWSLETLMDSIKADHGYNMDSKTVKNLLQTMSELTPAQRRDFLQFTTGSPKLPIGGFRSLTPMFTVVCKPSEAPYTSDDYLPSVMTCVNYLKLPDYSNLTVLRKQLLTAIQEGQGAFHLS